MCAPEPKAVCIGPAQCAVGGLFIDARSAMAVELSSGILAEKTG